MKPAQTKKHNNDLDGYEEAIDMVNVVLSAQVQANKSILVKDCVNYTDGMCMVYGHPCPFKTVTFEECRSSIER